ncbi:MAG TPA: hypothetical protein VHT50_08520 [Mycobacterium sp.]|nr:hypothetical protein [Mycobacterium sp.]
MRIPRSLAAAAVVAAYAAAVRPRMLRAGATDAEVNGRYPGAELVPNSRRGATMAATIDATPSQVWPWLVQMGHDRAGWYSWDRLDNFGMASADRIHPEWQTIAIGDRLASTPSGSQWFEVAAADPPRFLALRASFDLRGRPVAHTSLRPRAYTDSVWCFLLNELPDGRTRLVVSGYGCERPRPLGAVIDFLLWEPAHWIMQKRQFTNLKRRAEHAEAEEAPAPVPTG